MVFAKKQRHTGLPQGPKQSIHNRMSESLRILPNKGRLSESDYGSTLDRDHSRIETPAGTDSIPSMWNLIFVNTAGDNEKERPATAQANGVPQVCDL